MNVANDKLFSFPDICRLCAFKLGEGGVVHASGLYGANPDFLKKKKIEKKIKNAKNRRKKKDGEIKMRKERSQKNKIKNENEERRKNFFEKKKKRKKHLISKLYI